MYDRCKSIYGDGALYNAEHSSRVAVVLCGAAAYIGLKIIINPIIVSILDM
jgi:hypothetical protein